MIFMLALSGQDVDHEGPLHNTEVFAARLVAICIMHDQCSLRKR